MQCVFGSARKATAMHKLPLLWLLSSSENCTSPRVISLSVVEYHRLMELVTGQREWSPAHLFKLSAIDEWPVSTGDGRPAKASCRICFWQQQRAKHSMAMHFKQCMHQPHSLSYSWLKGGWVSILGPPIAHFNAWWPKKPSIYFDMECNAHNQTKGLDLYHTQLKRWSMHANGMQPRRGG